MFWTKTIGLIAVLIDHGRWWGSGGREGTRAYLRGANLRAANLSGADLSGAYLSDADLSDADLRDADLSDADLRDANLRDANLSDAYLGGADLSGADLSDANLSGADLGDANLSGANLSGAGISGANLSGAGISGAGIPVVPHVHTQTLSAIEAGGIFDMLNWHGNEPSDGNACGTTHCRAGWAIHLAGEAGYALEKQVGPSMAGALIIQASCPWIDRVPDFGATNDAALADIRLRADEEQAREVAL